MGNKKKKTLNKKALFRKKNKKINFSGHSKLKNLNALEKNKNKKGSNETMWPRIIGFILLAVIIVVAAGASYQMGIVQKVKDLFPNYAPENLSLEELRGLGCDAPIAQIKTDGMWGFKSQILYMLQGDHGTNIIWDYNKGQLYFQYGEKIFGGEKVIVGGIEKGVVKIVPDFLNPNSETYLKYKYDSFHGTGLSATIDDLRLLDNSFKLENNNYLCKNDGQFQDYKNSLTCNLNCSIINGVCSVSGTSCEKGYISYGQLGCPSSQQCCVKENENIREDGKLYIDSFAIAQIPLYGQPLMKNMFYEDHFDATYGNKIIIYTGTSKDSNPFCYSVTSDKKILTSGYVSEFNDPYSGHVEFTPSIERSLQFVAWNKDNKKVIERVKLNVTAGYEDGIQIVDGKDFKSIIDASEVGSVFYISIPPVLLKDGKTRISNFRIKVISNDAVLVEGQFYEMVPHGDIKTGEYVWKQLNCNIGTTNSKLYISKMAVSENSFRETILKNCEVNKYWGLFG